MSGIVIDVDAKAGSANKELEQLNRNIANIVNHSNSSKKALNGLSATNFTKMTSSIKSTADSLRTMGTTGPKSLNNINAATKNTVGTFEKLQSVAVKAGIAFAAFSSIKYLTNTADALTNVQNRLNLVNGEAQDLVARQRELFVLSQRTRTSYEATANTFVDFARGLEGTGVSAADAIKSLDSLQKAAVLSGSSTESVNAALRQLGQGLAAGALRGEELNSVLEQMKYIGPGLAKQLGMSLGQLREFASQGQLTPQLLAKALVGMNRQVSQDFAKTTATTSQAFTQLREAASYFFGDISKNIGLSNLFSNTMIKMSESLLFASDNFVIGFNLIKRSISNFIRAYDNKSAFAVTVEGALNLDFNPTKTISKYKQNAVIKRTIEDIRETFNVDNLFVEDAGDRDTFTKKFFGIFVDVGETLKPVRRVLTDLVYLRDSVLQVGKLFIGVIDLAVVSTQRVLRAIPLLEFPFKTYVTSLKDFLYTSAVDIDTGLRAVYKPITRNLEAFTEVISLYTLGDNRLERGWVNLFKSDSLEEFTDNLFNLSSVMKSVRRNDVNAVFRDATSGFGSFVFEIEKVLVKLNLLDNRLFGFSGRAVDNFKRLASSLGSVLGRIFEDVIAPALRPVILKTLITLKTLGDTLYDGIVDNFTVSSGERLARGFYSGLVSGFNYVRNALSKAVNFSFIDIILGKNPVAIIQNKFTKVFTSVLSFLIGFVSEAAEITSNIFDETGIVKAFSRVKDRIANIFSDIAQIISEIRHAIGDTISSFKIDYKLNFNTTLIEDAIYFIVKLFETVYDYAREKLSSAFGIVKDFAEGIKELFFEVYDDVVGNSYWPDTIDGILEYTRKLFKAEADLNSFKNFVLSVFENIKSSIVSFGESTGGLFGDLVVTVAEIDVSKAKELLISNLQGIVAAGLAIKSGSLPAQIAGYGYFTALVNQALGGALTDFTPKVLELVGKTAAGAGAQLAKGYLIGLDMILASIPSFISGITSAFLPLDGVIQAVFKFVPGVNNTLLQGITAVSLALAAIKKDWAGGFQEFIFGTEGRGRKPGTEGLIDYVQAILPEFLQFSGPGLLTSLFGDRTMVAAAAAAAFASINLQSITVFEGAGLGLPLLAFALLGKDGGARLIKDTTALVGQIATIAVTTTFRATTGILGLSSAADTVIESLSTKFESTTSTKRVQASFRRLMSELLQIPANLNLNKDKYASGEMSFAETLFTMPNGKQAEIRKRFNTFMKSLGEQSLGNGKLSDYWKDFSDNAQRAGLSVGNVIRDLGNYSLFSGSWWSQRQKFASGFFASSETSAKKSKLSFSELASTLGGLFTNVKFGEITLNLKSGLDAVKSSASNTIDTVINLITAFAGLKSASNLKTIADSVSGAIPKPSVLKRGAEAAKNILISTLSDMSAPKLLTDGTGAKKFRTSFIGLELAVINIFRTLKALGILLARLASAAVAFAAPFLKIGAIAVGVGALALWLFGPGNTFRDNLEWAKDQIAGIFGSSPKSEVGRLGGILKNIEGLRATEASGRQVNLSKELSRVDFNKASMSEAEYSALLEVTEEFSTAIKELDKSILKRGYETSADRIRRAELTSEYTDTVRRKSMKPEKSLQDAIKTLDGSTKPANDFVTVFGRLKKLIASFTATVILNIPLVAPVIKLLGDAFIDLKSKIKPTTDFLSSLTFEDILGGIVTLIKGIGIAIAAGFAAVVVGLSLPVAAVIGVFAGLGYFLYNWSKSIRGVVDSAEKSFGSVVDGITKKFEDLQVALGLIRLPREIDKLRAQGDQTLSQDFLKAAPGLSYEKQSQGKGLIESLAAINTSFQDDLERNWFESGEAYDKRVAEAEAQYNADRLKHYDALNKLIVEGNKNLSITGFQQSLDNASKLIKDQLNIDLGAGGIDFLGTGEQLKGMEAAAQRVAKLRAQYKTNDSAEQRRTIAVDIAITRQAQKDLNEAINSMLTDAARAAKVEETLGGLVGQNFVQFIAGSQPAAAKEMNKIAESIAINQAKLKTASLFDTPKILQEISRLKKELADLTDPSKFRFEDLNAGFQALGLEQMNSQLYLSMSRDQVTELSNGIKTAITSQQTYNDVVLDGKSSWDQINQAMANAIVSTQRLKSLQAKQSAQTLQDITSTPGLTPRGQLYVAEQFGLAGGIPASARKSDAAAAKALKLATKMQSVNAKLMDTTSKFSGPQGMISSLRIDPAAANEAAALQAEYDKLGESIGKIGEASSGSAKTLNDLTSALSATGIEVSALGFSRLDDDTSKALKSIGSKLIALNKQIEAAPIGASVKKIFESQTALLDMARQKLISVISKTGEGILGALSSANISETSIIAGLAKNEIDTIIDLYAKVITARQRLNTTSDTESFVKQAKELLTAERSLNRFSQDVNDTFESRLSLINETFGTSLSNLELSRMDVGFAQTLVDKAKALKAEVESIDKSGIAADTGRAATAVFSEIESLAKLGRLVEIFKQAGSALKESISEGAEAGYERVKKVFSRFDLTLREFTFLSDEDRKSMSKQATQLELLRKLANEELPDAAASIIESFDGTNLQAVTDQLSETLGGDFLKKFESPTAQLIDVLFKNVAATKELVAATTGQPLAAAPAAPAGMEPSQDLVVTARQPNLRNVRGSALRAILDQESNLFSDTVNKSLQGMSSREAAGVAVAGKSYFDDKRLLNLANPKELQRFNEIGVKVRKLYQDLDKAIKEGLDPSLIQAQIDSYDAQLQRIPSVIEANANRIAEAGKSMGETFNSSVGDALKGLMKGEMSFSSAMSSLAENVTNKVIDSFVDSLIAPLTGEGSFLFGIFDKLGQTTAAGASQLGTTIAGQPTAPAAQVAGGIGNLFKSKKNPAVTAVAEAAAPVASAASALPDAAKEIAGPIGDVMPDAANKIASGCLDLGSQVEGLAGKAGGGGMAGLAGMAGGLLGMLIGGFFADGGLVSGPGTGTSDSVLAGVSNGEFIVNAKDTKKNLPLLKTINSGKLSSLLPKFANGGLVDTSMVDTPAVGTLAVIPATKSRDNSTVVNLSITGDISRQTRSEIYQMLPSIAEGVNMHNREKGYR